MFTCNYAVRIYDGYGTRVERLASWYDFDDAYRGVIGGLSQDMDVHLSPVLGGYNEPARLGNYPKRWKLSWAAVGDLQSEVVSRTLLEPPRIDFQGNTAVETGELVPSTEFIVKRLQDANLQFDEECELILNAEMLRSLDANQADELKSSLISFVRRQKNSADRRTRVVVASAVRKYIALIDQRELGSVDQLLDPQGGTVPPDVELEVAKMVVRKLTFKRRRFPIVSRYSLRGFWSSQRLI